ncbi:hypothetical protein [Gordonia phage Tarzan]|uniref:Uncharacterized protein n=1 Tax=Gordonia phage Tarzan TaxID=3038367 RepID=A0AAF0GJC0_9CAUD|nr:hypothetical protein QLQ76_gp58 [Gordonia phage Tarzan]WGH20091.1 hypothetical protein [Gordonia phage Tarzan]
MTDPAIKAAVTAMLTVETPTVRDTAIAAAREALAPVRQWHEEWLRYVDGLEVGGDHIRAVLRDLPPLIYPSEEL